MQRNKHDSKLHCKLIIQKESTTSYHMSQIATTPTEKKNCFKITYITGSQMNLLGLF